MINTTFQVGELIENRYRVLTVIGTGGMGTLYHVSDKAHQDGTPEGKVIALKTVRLKGSATEATESVERFQREFQLLTQLNHPNLVSVYNYGVTTGGELYFTMEWIEGENLEPSEHRLEPGETIGVMVQVCRALAYLHARGVIHGDLKPANVLMLNDQIKLVDFGVAHEVRSPEDRARYYTPGYAAPETRQPHPIDHRADLYSLGAMWFALLVGEAPMFMPGAGKERLIQFALEEALEKQEQIPQAIGDLIARLMATSSDDRYGSANEVIEAVNEITGSEYTLETRETASSYALRTRFVNREEELETLQTLWEQAKSNAGKLVLLSGESGVGKSRLVRELEIQAEFEGARVVWGQCVESGGSAYQPWREVLRVLVRYVEGINETADGATMQQVGPVLATLLPELWERDYMRELAPPADLDPQAAQQRLNNNIVQVIHAAAELRLTVIVIENAHWADEATLEMLQFLARIPGHVGLLMCIAYRDDGVEADHRLEKLAGERVQRIRLHRLSPKVTTELVCSMLGLEQLPPLLTERVQQTTGGNAFFAQELIRSLATEGKVLRRTVRGWQVDEKALQEARLPESIRQVVWRRLTQLSAETQQMLSWAAVAGMVFWEGSLTKVGHSPTVETDAPMRQMTRQRVRMALREGLEQGLVRERDESAFAREREYLFSTSTMREVSYESLSLEEQREVHKQIAKWLMARSDEEIEEHLGLIADHLEGAGQVEQAAIYLRRAGEQAAAQFANTEAARYFGHALDLVAGDDGPAKIEQRYELLLAREKVYDLQAAREAQARDLAALEELAEAIDGRQQVTRRRIEAALRRAHYADVTGDYAAVIAAARRVIDLARAAQTVNSEAAGYRHWGQALWRQGEYKAARTQLEQALVLSQTTGERQVEADSLRELGQVANGQGRYSEAITFNKQALHIYRELGARQSECRALDNLGWFSGSQGDYASSLIYHEEALDIAREIGCQRSEAIALGNLGIDSVYLGDYDAARAYHKEPLRIFGEIGDQEGECRTLSNLAWISHLVEDYEATREYSERGLRIARRIGSRRWQGYTLTNLGHALVGLGQLDEAAIFYRQALDIRQALGERNLSIESLAGLARVSLAQGDLAQAQAHVEEILSFLEGQDFVLYGTDEPFRAYLTCYHVLRASLDPRAEAILNTTRHLLQEQAAKISDEKLRRSFLENVAVHRELTRIE